MKKIFFLFTLLSIVYVPGFSQTKEKDLEKLFELMNLDKLIESMMQGMMPVMEKIDADLSSEMYDKYMKVTMEEAKNFTKKILDKEMLPLYDRNFTHEEIKDLVAFFSSSTGQKMLEKAPVLSAELGQIIADKYLQEFEEDLLKKLEKIE